MTVAMPHEIQSVLNDTQVEMLQRLSETYDTIPILMLFEQAHMRYRELEEARREGSAVHLRMANALFQALKKAVERWNHLESDAGYWFKGAVGYFISDDDEVGDFDSDAGLLDDLEVINACLTYAKLPDLVLDPYDF